MAKAKKASKPRASTKKTEAVKKVDDELRECEALVSSEQVEKAVSALMELYQKNRINAKDSPEEDGKIKLFDDEHEEEDEKQVVDFEKFPIEKDASRLFDLIVNLSKIDPSFFKTTRGYKVDIKHPFVKAKEDLEVCIIVPSDEIKAMLKEMIEEHGEEFESLRSIKKIFSFPKLKKIFPSPQSKRELSMMYDVFLTDLRTMQMTGNTLGKHFVAGPKRALPVRLFSFEKEKEKENFKAPLMNQKYKGTINLTPKEISESISDAVEATYFYPRSTNCPVKVGRIGMKPSEVRSNVHQVIKEVLNLFKESGTKIQGLHLKTSKSPSLPLFVSVPSSDDLEKDDAVDENDEKLKEDIAKRDKTRAHLKKRAAEKRKNLAAKKIKVH